MVYEMVYERKVKWNGLVTTQRVVTFFVMI